MRCLFKASGGVQCERDAEKGDTMCKRHHTAGISRKHYKRMQEQKVRKASANQSLANRAGGRYGQNRGGA